MQMQEITNTVAKNISSNDEKLAKKLLSETQKVVAKNLDDEENKNKEELIKIISENETFVETRKFYTIANKFND